MTYLESIRLKMRRGEVDAHHVSALTLDERLSEHNMASCDVARNISQTLPRGAPLSHRLAQSGDRSTAPTSGIAHWWTRQGSPRRRCLPLTPGQLP